MSKPKPYRSPRPFFTLCSLVAHIPIDFAQPGQTYHHLQCFLACILLAETPVTPGCCSLATLVPDKAAFSLVFFAKGAGLCFNSFNFLK